MKSTPFSKEMRTVCMQPVPQLSSRPIVLSLNMNGSAHPTYVSHAGQHGQSFLKLKSGLEGFSSYQTFSSSSPASEPLKGKNVIVV
jgi:hypothetical protein